MHENAFEYGEDCHAHYFRTLPCVVVGSQAISDRRGIHLATPGKGQGLPDTVLELAGLYPAYIVVRQGLP